MNEAFLRFREMVFADPDLRCRLQAEPDREKFLELVVWLAAERGCPFTRETAENVLRRSNRVWFERLL